MKIEQILIDISTILMRSELSLEAQKKIMDGVKKQLNAESEEKTCTIFGVESCEWFKIEVPMSDVAAKCYHIWTNTKDYSQYENNSEDAYYKFTRCLWVSFPDGSPDQRLSDIAKEYENTHKED